MRYVVVRLDHPGEPIFTHDMEPYREEADAGRAVVLELEMCIRYFRGKWAACMVKVDSEEMANKKMRHVAIDQRLLKTTPPPPMVRRAEAIPCSNEKTDAPLLADDPAPAGKTEYRLFVFMALLVVAGIVAISAAIMAAGVGAPVWGAFLAGGVLFGAGALISWMAADPLSEE